MPNIKSAKKRVIVNNRKAELNKSARSEFKTAIKKIETLIKDNKLEEAKALLPETFAIIDATAGKNVIHANNAANKKAKISKKLSDAIKASGVTEAAPAEAIAEAETVAEVPAEEPVKKTRKPRAKKVDAE